jgi:hypothetical protein
MKKGRSDQHAAGPAPETQSGTSAWSLHVLGTGAAGAVDLGSSGAVLERDGEPRLLIDCGPGTLEH